MSAINRYLLLKFNKNELDYFSTLFGLITTVAVVLTTNLVLNNKLEDLKNKLED